MAELPHTMRFAVEASESPTHPSAKASLRFDLCHPARSSRTPRCASYWAPSRLPWPPSLPERTPASTPRPTHKTKKQTKRQRQPASMQPTSQASRHCTATPRVSASGPAQHK
eukprot:2224678-Rhodomonas_salina.2